MPLGGILGDRHFGEKIDTLTEVASRALRKFGCYFFCIFKFAEGESESHPITFLAISAFLEDAFLGASLVFQVLQHLLIF